MHMGHQYRDLHHVKEEVSASALTMLQAGVPSNLKVPHSSMSILMLCVLRNSVRKILSCVPCVLYTNAQVNVSRN